MKISYIDIINFKGINHIRLDLNYQPQSNIYVLVGINESGKTTILEAINFLKNNLEYINPPGYKIDDLPGKIEEDIYKIIPVGRISNFNENISIKVGYTIESSDKEKIKEFCSDKFNFKITKEIQDFFIENIYIFKNSELKNTSIMWSLKLFGKKKYARKEGELKVEEWRQVVKQIGVELLPNILYFPNFLFDFPDKIYLEHQEKDEKKHEFYRTVIQNILNAIEKDVNIEDHILSRAKNNNDHSNRTLDSILVRMGSHVSSTIFDKWDNIFKRPITNKETVFKCDKDENESYFLQLRIKEGNQLYSITEKSLGFRWFFTFLLLTQYGGFHKDSFKNIFFLMDEPASNLHPSAQKQLLEIFDNFEKNYSIIYTTHSHYMINTKWLENTFIVKNEGLDYENVDKYKAIDTDIKIYKYRDFVSKYPDQTTYFKPILDVLDYRPGELENIPNIAMVEGKNDFYTLKYVYEKILNCPNKLHLLPGCGASSLEPIIRIYIAWGRRFIILLDADKEGLKQKERYEQIPGIVVNKDVFCLNDIDKTWRNIGTEYLFEEEERIKIQSFSYPTSLKFDKTHFNRAIQELYLNGKQIVLSTATKERFQKIFDFCIEKLG